MRWTIPLTLLLLQACDSSSSTPTTAPTCDENLQQSPSDCGACGHSCWNGECIAGVCQAVEVAQEPLGQLEIDVDGEYVAYIGNLGVTLMRLRSYLATEGRREPRTVGSAPNMSGHFASADGTLYFTAVTGLYRVVESGLAELIFTPPDSLGSNQLDAAPNVVVWRAEPSAAGYELYACDPANCTSTAHPFYTSAQVVNLTEVLTDGTHAAFIQDNTLKTCTIDNCAATLTTHAVDDNSFGAVFALRDGQLAWSDAGKIMTCTLPTCTPTQLFTLAGAPALDVTGDGVFVPQGRSIMNCPLAGCNDTPREVSVERQIGPLYDLRVTDEFFVWVGSEGVHKRAR